MQVPAVTTVSVAPVAVAPAVPAIPDVVHTAGVVLVNVMGSVDELAVALSVSVLPTVCVTFAGGAKPVMVWLALAMTMFSVTCGAAA